MVRRNRVDPWGDLHAAAARGLFTGNRGCLVDDGRQLVRHHRGSLWITCVTEFRGRRRELDRPRSWTPLFFLDDAVALAAGHRPCGECRRAAYTSYRDAVYDSFDEDAVKGRGAGGLNRLLAAERLRPGRGLDRRADRLVWSADLADLPPGVVIVDDTGRALLVGTRTLQAFGFDRWGPPEPRTGDGGSVPAPVQVLTPPTSVAALAGGFRPLLHPSAVGAGGDSR